MHRFATGYHATAPAAIARRNNGRMEAARQDTSLKYSRVSSLESRLTSESRVTTHDSRLTRLEKCIASDTKVQLSKGMGTPP